MTQNPNQQGPPPQQGPNDGRGQPARQVPPHLDATSQPASYPGAEPVSNPNGHFGAQGSQPGDTGSHPIVPGPGQNAQGGRPGGTASPGYAPLQPHSGPEGAPSRRSNGGPGPGQAGRPGGQPGAAPRLVSPEGERVREKPAGGISGYFMIVCAVILLLVALLLGVFGFIMTFVQAGLGVALFIVAVLCFIASMFMFRGCTSVAPGHAVVLQLYGKYVGTVRQSGLRFVNPLYSKDQVSTRIRNHETSTLKVNDLDGNPIEIGAVVVWQVKDTAQAKFEVDDFEEFVAIQAETAVRHIANSYAYDSSDPRRMSLRDNADEITSRLSDEVAARVAAAGVTIIESRITQLAYAPEIARSMLQRQQATAVVAARQLIVEGAVGMVETAIEQIEGRNIVTLGQAERSDLVSNLMIVLCGDQSAQPTISTSRNQNSNG